MSKELSNKIRFLTFIIPMFAMAYKMNNQNAYLYLEKYGALDYLSENWWALHTDNPYWAVRELYEICYQNGGPK